MPATSKCRGMSPLRTACGRPPRVSFVPFADKPEEYSRGLPGDHLRQGPTRAAEAAAGLRPCRARLPELGTSVGEISPESILEQFSAAKAAFWTVHVLSPPQHPTSASRPPTTGTCRCGSGTRRRQGPRCMRSVRPSRRRRIYQVRPGQRGIRLQLRLPRLVRCTGTRRLPFDQMGRLDKPFSCSEGGYFYFYDPAKARDPEKKPGMGSIPEPPEQAPRNGAGRQGQGEWVRSYEGPTSLVK